MLFSGSAKRIISYVDGTGNEPFANWLNRLKDKTVHARVIMRLRRLAEGHYGDVKSVGDGVKELRLFFGPGYRIYFAEEGKTVVVLLCGGDKGTQDRDIDKAKQYWKEYQSCR